MKSPIEKCRKQRTIRLLRTYDWLTTSFGDKVYPDGLLLSFCISREVNSLNVRKGRHYGALNFIEYVALIAQQLRKLCWKAAPILSNVRLFLKRERCSYVIRAGAIAIRLTKPFT